MPTGRMWGLPDSLGQETTAVLGYQGTARSCGAVARAWLVLDQQLWISRCRDLPKVQRWAKKNTDSCLHFVGFDVTGTHLGFKDRPGEVLTAALVDE